MVRELVIGIFDSSIFVMIPYMLHYKQISFQCNPGKTNSVSELWILDIDYNLS